ncbi:UNVERIFIED_CONTAM: hypothetical protein Cloal_0829 [Acetivibrio alkalicellulosi]
MKNIIFVSIILLFFTSSCVSVNEENDISNNSDKVASVSDNNNEEASVSDNNNNEESGVVNQYFNEGYELFQYTKTYEVTENNWEEISELYLNALDKFYQAIINTDNINAYYYYARTVSCLININYEILKYASFPTEFNIINNDNLIRTQHNGLDELFSVLQHIIKIDNSYIDIIKNEDDFSIIRKEYNFMLLQGYSPLKNEDIKVILRELDWYIWGKGVILTVGGIDFNKDGRFILWYYTPEALQNADFDIPKYKVTGFYSVVENKIIMELDEKMFKKRTIQDIYTNTLEYDDELTLIGSMTEEGELVIDIFEQPIWYIEDSII